MGEMEPDMASSESWTYEDDKEQFEDRSVLLYKLAMFYVTRFQ